MIRNLIVTGFGDNISCQVVPLLLTQDWVHTLHWVVDTGRLYDRPPQSDQLLVIDHYDALFPKGESDLHPAAEKLYNILQATLMFMMDRLENYGPPIEYNQRKASLQILVSYWCHYVDDHKIEGFVGSNVPHEIFDYVIAFYIDYIGCPVRYFFQWRVDVLLPLNHYRQLGTAEAGRISPPGPHEQLCLKQVWQKIVKTYTAAEDTTQTVPFYMKRRTVAEQRAQARRHYWRRLFAKITSPTGNFATLRGLRYFKHLVYDKPFTIKQQTRQLYHNYNQRVTSTIDLKAKFVYFPLHLQPEATTSPLAGIFRDQRFVAELLLEALPDDWYVYIKENPKQGIIGRGKHYYDGFPPSERIVFVDINTSTDLLRRYCSAVATCTGTVGFESIWDNKPVLAFGYPYYGDAPGVFQITDPRQVHVKVVQMLEGHWQRDVASSYVKKLVMRSLCVNIADYYQSHSTVRPSVEECAQRIVTELRHTLADVNGE